MSDFSQLLKDLESTNLFPINVETITSWLKENGYQDEITFTPVVLDEKKVIAYLRRYRDLASPYQEGQRIAAIRYSNKLNTCWRRFVCTKELMHFFDNPEQQVKSRETYSDFISDLSLSAVERGASTLAGQADFDAINKALLCLAPLHSVEHLRSARKNGDIDDLTIAERLRIPREVIRRVFLESHADSYVKAKHGIELPILNNNSDNEN